MDPKQATKDAATSEQTTSIHEQNSNAESLHYEDGKIQKKVYGGGDGHSCREIYVHLIEKEKQTVQTLVINAEDCLTLNQISTILQQKTKIALNNLEVKYKLEGQASDLGSTLAAVVDGSEAKPQLYFFFDETKAIIKQKVSEIKYEPLTKYSFIDDKSKVKVYLELQGIGKIPAENIQQRFLEWSIQIKIHDYKGKNWLFAVPKTQCLLKPKESKVIQKQNRLIISIGKNAEADNWFSLYKVKCVGERDD